MHLRALFLLRASSNAFCSCPQGFRCQQCLQAALASTGACQKWRCHNNILWGLGPYAGPYLWMCFSYLCPAAPGFRIHTITSHHFITLTLILLQVACLAEEIEIIEKQMAGAGMSSMNEEYWCTLQSHPDPDDIFEGYWNSGIIQDYYLLHQQPTQDYIGCSYFWFHHMPFLCFIAVLLRYILCYFVPIINST